MDPMRLLAAVSLLLILSGCTGNLAELHALAPASNDFPSALAAEYLAYGESEKEQGRPIIADKFAEKGLKRTEDLTNKAKPYDGMIFAVLNK